jgi:hypothetical protein
MASGFQPTRPALSYRDRFPVVESVKPTLAWSPFPGTDYDLTPGSSWKPTTFVSEEVGATNVRYDLIIWKPVNPHYDDFSRASTFTGRAWRAVDALTAVYERSGLTIPTHTVESELEPGTEYAWSVRARFDVNGQVRISEWSLVADAYPFPDLLDGLGRTSRERARRTGELPPYALYYFITP